MDNKQVPLEIEGIQGSLYAGFWHRLASMMIDVIIVMPIGFLFMYLNGKSTSAYYYTIIPFLLFHFWYGIYLVKKNGGTPGKLIVGIKIINLNGDDVGWNEALLRQVVTYALTFFGSVITIISLSKANPIFFESLGWFDQQQYINSLSPTLFTFYLWMNNIWVYGELIILMTNKRRRAFHDFIANTVVVQTKYIDRMREVVNSTETPASPAA